MAASKTCLSAGEIIRSLLTADAEVSARANKIYPVVADEAVLPYVVYSRQATDRVPAKGFGGNTGADTATVEIACYTADYTSGVELAEAVRAVLDGALWEGDGWRMRSCTLTDSSEGWAADAFVQYLTFTIKI